MSNLHADYYADEMVQVDAPMEQHELIGEGTYRLRVAAPAIAAAAVPGQFVMIRCLLYTSPSPRDQRGSRMPSSA